MLGVVGKLWGGVRKLISFKGSRKGGGLEGCDRYWREVSWGGGSSVGVMKSHVGRQPQALAHEGALYIR